MKRYLVGGCVRDQLLGRPIRDRDWLVVGATTGDMLARGFQQVGKDFPVFLHPLSREEHALARGTTVTDDLAARDLTINAMAMGEDGALIDPFGGRADLEARVLRPVPGFARDPIRILRAARFAAQLDGFTIAPETLALMTQLTAAGALDAATPERMWLELDKALGCDRPSRFFLALRECGALARLLPEVDVLFDVPQPIQHHPEGDVGTHTMMVVDAAARLTADRAVRFAALVHDVGKGLTPTDRLPSHPGHEEAGAALIKPLVRRLAGPMAWAELGTLVARWHGQVHKAAELRPGTMLTLLEAADAFHHPERLEALLLACEADFRGRLGKENAAYPQADRIRAAATAAATITARDLIKAGHAPGPRLGEVLFQKRAETIRQTLPQ
jgi:tRNA nucleotidyltransferase (CCA-adding enzyme)